MSERGGSTSLDAFSARLRASGVDVHALVTETDGTIHLAAHATTDGPLPALGESQLKMLREIGRGGMGEVHLAEQRDLRRSVAVKRAARRDDGSRGSGDALIVEACVTGNLEHPNIVPVYSLGQDDDGNVLLVMKRIDGRVWADVLREDFGALADQLAVLREVCRAVHFAHERGVIHRDLKPSNVMLGSFGEVYVLDWGLAAALDERAPAPIPRASETTAIVGTPAYLAPEMTTPGAELDRRTDVYLLGATLFEVVTGRPPHARDTLVESLHSAFLSEPPTLSDDVPEELRAIIARALHKDPASRFATALELLDALVAFEQHSSARELCAQASVRLEALAALPIEADSDAEALALFHEARFGFSEAKRQWPEGAVAAAGLRNVVVAMVRRELDRGRGDAARLLAEELDDVPTSLRVRLEELDSQHATMQTRAARTEALERERDWRVERRARAYTSFAFTAFWFPAWLTLLWLRERGVEPTTTQVAWWHLTVIVTPALAFAIYPKPFLSTQLNRRLATLTAIALLHAQGIWVVGATAGLPIDVVIPLVHTAGAGAFCTLATQDRAYLWGAAGQTVGVVVTLLVEDVLTATIVMHAVSLFAPSVALLRAPPPDATSDG